MTRTDELKALAKEYVDLLGPDGEITDEAASFANLTHLTEDEAVQVATYIKEMTDAAGEEKDSTEETNSAESDDQTGTAETQETADPVAEAEAVAEPEAEQAEQVVL